MGCSHFFGNPLVTPKNLAYVAPQMNTPSQVMVTSSARCPVPQSGRTFIVAIAFSLGLHAVAIAAAGVWYMFDNASTTEEPACPVTQFMKVHLIKQPAAPESQLASVAPAAQKAPAKQAAAQPAPRKVAATKPVPATPVAAPAMAAAQSAQTTAAHPDFIAEAEPAAAPAAASAAGSSPATAVLAQVAPGTNTAITYPSMARENGWEGTVTLKFWLNEQGRASQFRIAGSSGFPILDAKALQTVKTWRFQQSSVWAELPVVFQLTQNE